MRRPPRGAKLKRTQAPPVRVSRALTRNVPWYVLAGMIFGLFRLTRLQAQEAERVALEKAAQERERATDQPVAVAQVPIVDENPQILSSVNPTVLADPTIEASERKIYATLTKRLIVRGSGFSLDGTELTLRPTSRSSYEVESVEMAEMVLILKEGKSWVPAKTKDDGKPVSIYVTKIDTGAGEVVMEDDGAIVARVFPDPSGDERAAAEERERAEEERFKRKKEARREQEEREEREAANGALGIISSVQPTKTVNKRHMTPEQRAAARREARLAAAANILLHIVLPLFVCPLIAIGALCVFAVIAIPVVCVSAAIVGADTRAERADTDAEMVPADIIANPTLFRSLLNA